MTLQAPSPPLARLEGASKRYGAIQALHRLDLELRPGEVLALLGPNGAGKTSALGLLTGRLSPDTGAARVLGRDPRDAQARRAIGVMLQEASLPDALRVDELVRLFASYYPAPRTPAETLALAGLAPLARRRYDQLSGGQQRRVHFALAICGRPALLFVDEPTTGLDVEARRGFWQVLRALRDEGVSIVLTTHYLEEADALADRIVLLAEGRVLAEGSPTAIKARVAGRRMRCRSALATAVLAGWPEVDAVARDGEWIDLRSTRPEALLRRLLAADPSLDQLEVAPLSLEEAFLTLTRPLQEAA